MHGFPIIGGHHFNGIPGTAVKKCSVRSVADAFLTANAEVRINFDASEWRVIFVGNPEHAGLNGTVLDAGRGPSAPRAAVGGDRKNSRSLLAGRFAVTF